MQNVELRKSIRAALGTLVLAWMVPAGPAVAQTGGTIVSWGSDPYGQLGDNSAYPYADRLSPAQVVGPTGTGSIMGVIGIAGGATHSLAVKSDGTVWAWGDGSFRDLGIGASNVPYNKPVQVQDPTDATDQKLHNVKAVAAGLNHGLALKNDGTVWGWGANYVGQLGDGTVSNLGYPVQASGLSGIIAIAAGWGHSLAVKSDGTVWAFGLNQYGELGDGTNIDRHVAVQVIGLTDVKAVAAGSYFSLALKNDGTVWAWGGNDLGTLGHCSPDYTNAPVQVLTYGTNCIGGLGGVSGVPWPGPLASPGPALTGITAIAASVTNGMALDGSGTVWMWGANDQGGLGDGIIGYPYFPYNNSWPLPPFGTSSAMPVPGLPVITAIAAGYGAGHAVAADGKVWGWGYDLYGGVGDGSVITTNPQAVTTAVQVLNLTATGPLTDVTSLASGWMFNLALVSTSGTSTPPPAPAISSNPANPTNQTGAAFNFSDTQSGVTFVCSLDASSYTACTSGQSYSNLAQGSHTFNVEAKDSSGTLSTPTSFTWTIDTTLPLISGTATPAANANGWNKTSVTVTFNCSDVLSGIASCSSATTLNAEGALQVVTGTAVDNAGNTAQAKITVNIDETNPTVSYTGGGTYTVDQTVNITCDATDALSGIASSTCGPKVSGPAYSFTLGTTYSYSATATDKAGNTGSGSTSFTVTVTSASLINLVPKFETKPAVAATMVATLQGAQAAFASGNIKSGDNQLNAFISQVIAQSGKAGLTTAQASLLIQFAMALMQ